MKNPYGYNPKAEKYSKDDAVYDLIFGGLSESISISWKNYLPPREKQWWIPFCVTFSRLNCAEAVGIKNDVELNFSDRELGVISDTSKMGNGLANVSETFRKKGVVKENDCRFTAEMLAGGWGEWNEIFELPDLKDRKRYFGGNYSRILTKPMIKNALAFSPVQIAVGLGNNWEKRGTITPPASIGSYHAITCYHIDKYNRYLIQDSIGREYKILSADYPIVNAMSFRDLPENWKERNNPEIKLYKTPASSTVYLYGFGDGMYHPITHESFVLDLFGNWSKLKVEIVAEIDKKKIGYKVGSYSWLAKIFYSILN